MTPPSVTALSPAGGWQTPQDYDAIAKSFRIIYALLPIRLRVSTSLQLYVPGELTMLIALLAASGAERIYESYSSWDRFAATHVFGTCRMGPDADAVVDDRDPRHLALEARHHVGGGHGVPDGHARPG